LRICQIQKTNNMLSGIYYLIALFLVLPNSVREVPFVLLALYSFYIFFKQRKINLRLFFLLSLFFWVNLLSLLYTEDLKMGLTRIEGFLPFFYVPLAYSILIKSELKFDKKIIVNWILLFNCSTLIFLVICSVFFYFSPLTITYNNIRTILDKIPFINIHPTYFSIVSILGTLTSFYLIRFRFKLGVFFILLNLFALFLSGSRASFLFYFILLIVVFAITRMKLKYKITIALGFIALFSLLFVVNHDFRNKFIFIFEKKSYAKVNLDESTSIRYAIWDCSVDRMKETNIVLGNGVGDVHKILQNCYDAKHPLLDQSYNSHNQYFSIFLGSGILGIVSLLIFLITVFKQAYSSKNKILMVLVLFYFYTFYFENVIERKYGITLFLFFSLFSLNFLITQQQSEENVPSSV
jgi:O-antigen ligase